MFVFQVFEPVVKKKDQQKMREEAVGELTKKNREFDADVKKTETSKGRKLTNDEKLDLAINAKYDDKSERAGEYKYRDQFRDIFLSDRIGGSKSEWDAMVQEYERRQDKSRIIRPVKSQNLTMETLRGVRISRDIASGQKYAEKAADEFSRQEPKTGYG
jgi:hypothetical protein